MQIFRDEKYSKKPSSEAVARNSPIHDAYIAYKEMQILRGEAEAPPQKEILRPSWRIFGRKHNEKVYNQENLSINEEQNAARILGSCNYSLNSVFTAFTNPPYKIKPDPDGALPVGKPVDTSFCKTENNFKGPYCRFADCPYKKPYFKHDYYTEKPQVPENNQNPTYNPIPMPPMISPIPTQRTRPCGYFTHEYKSEYMDSERIEVGNIEFNSNSEDNILVTLKQESTDKIVIPEKARYEIHYSITTSSPTLNGAKTKLLVNGMDVPLSEITLCNGLSENTMLLLLDKNDELSLFVDTVVSLVKGINSTLMIVAL